MTTAYFLGNGISSRQTPQSMDVPGRPPIDWIGVRPAGTTARVSSVADAAEAQGGAEGDTEREGRLRRRLGFVPIIRLGAS